MSRHSTCRQQAPRLSCWNPVSSSGVGNVLALLRGPSTGLLAVTPEQAGKSCFLASCWCERSLPDHSATGTGKRETAPTPSGARGEQPCHFHSATLLLRKGRGRDGPESCRAGCLYGFPQTCLCRHALTCSQSWRTERQGHGNKTSPWRSRARNPGSNSVFAEGRESRRPKRRGRGDERGPGGRGWLHPDHAARAVQTWGRYGAAGVISSVVPSTVAVVDVSSACACFLRAGEPLSGRQTNGARLLCELQPNFMMGPFGTWNQH